ncbi:unnamed protein product [Bemisia tabaci]|uniref:CCHC-type domain-containing protein n=1 Tax=Bemisia tabaci TaxID=7038 RepID=A0A9N9ZYV5_BEMTA|nr:unnamed protein product [Bemisia tabaci]
MSNLHTDCPPMSFEGNLSTNWKQWYAQFEICLVATDLITSSDHRKNALLLKCMSGNAFTIYQSFQIDISKTKFVDLVALFHKHFAPKPNVTVDRIKLFSKDKSTLAETFEFAQKIQLSKHRVEQLQSTPEVNVLNEQSSSSNRYSPLRYGRYRSPSKPRWSYSPTSSNYYNSRSAYPYQRSRNSGHRRNSPYPRYYRSRSSSRSSSRSRSPSPRRHFNYRPKGENCSNCGQHYHAYKCPAHGRTCDNCGKLNHFARYCPEKKLHNLNIESSDDDILFINNISCS